MSTDVTVAELVNLDLDDEVIFHLAIPESVARFRQEQVNENLIFDKFTKAVFAFQMDHMREHKAPASAAVLQDEFDGSNDYPQLQVFEPETAVGDLIQRLRQRYGKNQGKDAVKYLAKVLVERPDDIGKEMSRQARRINELMTRRGEVYGTGDFDRARMEYDKLAAKGAGPSLGYDDVDKHFNGMLGLTFLIGAPKSMKALDLNTPIPTPTGWTTMGDLRIGEQVFDELGNVCNVLAKSEVFYNRPCYNVRFSDGSEVVADEEHLWYTEMKVGTKRRADGTRTPAYRPGVRTTGEIRASLRRSDTLGSRHSIPVAEALDCPERDLEIDPYTLGVWLGDGTSREGSITTADLEVVRQIENADYKVVKRASSKYTYGVYGLEAQLRKLNLLNNKHIPAPYLRCSKDQRLALLQGLMDSDGTCCESGDSQFTTTNPCLRDGVLELTRTLGYKPSVRVATAAIGGVNYGQFWTVAFCAHEDTKVFRLERKYLRQRKSPRGRARSRSRQIVAITPVASRPVQCITVDSPNRLYLAGEGMVPTHNTWVTMKSVIENVSQGKSVYHYSLELPALESYWRMACLTADVPYWKYLKRLLMPDDHKKLQQAATFLDESGIFKTEKPAIGERGVERMVERALNAGADAIYIDQLQYVETRKGVSVGSQNNTGDYWEICNDLRDYSDDIPIWVVHQFNRSGASSKNEFPDAQQGKGSAAMEETATLELGLWANKEMKKNNMLQLGTLVSRNYEHAAWNLAINLSYGCGIDMIGPVEEDDEDEE